MNNRVVYFEIPSDNPQTSMDFYKEVFGWSFKKFGNAEYWSAISGDEKSPGINGGIMKKKDPKQPVVNSIRVENLDEYISRIEKAGGKIVVPKFSIPTVGLLAYFTDPDGNIFGIWQIDPDASK